MGLTLLTEPLRLGGSEPGLRVRSGGGAPAPVAFPTLASTVVARYVAGTGETVSSGRVSAWADQSASGNNATGDANAPWSKTDYLGRPVVRFDGQTVNGPTGMTLASGRSFTARNLAVFFVGRFAATTQTLVMGAGATAGSLRTLATSSVFNYSAQAVASGLRIRNNPALVGVVATATGQKVYTNIEDSSSGAAPTNTTGNGLILGHTATPSSYAHFDAYEIIVCEGMAIDAADIALIKAYAAAKYGLRTSAYTKNAVFVGDSITAGINGASSLAGEQFFQTSYPAQTLRSTTEDWKINNLGVSGATATSLPTLGADGYFDAAATKNVLIGLIGRNDIVGGASAATLYANIVSYVQARVAAGFTVAWGTLIASGSGIQATIDSTNALLRGTSLGGSGPGLIADAGASAILDFAALPEFDATGDSGNATYYQLDSTHPKIAGAALLANVAHDYLLVA